MSDNNKQITIHGTTELDTTKTVDVFEVIAQLPSEKQMEIQFIALQEQLRMSNEQNERLLKSGAGINDLAQTLSKVENFCVNGGGKGRVEIDANFTTGTGTIHVKAKKGGFF